MLDVIQGLLQNHQGELVGQLEEKAGFGTDEAKSFLPPALEQIGQALGAGGIDLGALLSGDGLGALLSKIDVGAIANQSEVDAPKAKSGLEALVPMVLSLLKQEGGGLEGLLGKLGGGGAAGALGGLAGKLFNR